ncbi:hypothetical protein ACFOUP_08165 [Belliella kenyensis]|uniref:Uncharacterized protein n=1 Tax=Belliella kenyensis TaxID=1472724 RepID=A0ABV8EJ66_9BACT|nr:hypothetical protein [Belliella kenyensis]MCH7403341.1 hypothetical protein [Belliella kenyensis]MDN3602982.1 hypothetical protein [Belliella kenyensis]
MTKFIFAVALFGAIFSMLAQENREVTIELPAKYKPKSSKFYVDNLVEFNTSHIMDWLTFFEKTFQPIKLKKLHDIWLAELKIKNENLW